MYLSAGPGSGAGVITYALDQTSDGQWSAARSAPTVAGQYFFTVGVFDSAGKRAIIENSAWMLNVTVPQPTEAPTVSPLPDSMPLAPGFSYGQPQAAVFTAAGQVVNGAVVESTTDNSADASALASFFETRLARAGWSVDQSTVPQTGATSWSISADSGAEVAVIQYAAGTLHIYYGES